MSDTQIREYRPGDVRALSALWQETFGDSEALVLQFFSLLPDMGFAIAAEQDGQIVGAAYGVTGIEIAFPKAPPKLCAYLYAVAVRSEHRGHGLGAALSRAVREEAAKRGAQIFCTQPAEPSLFAWYEKNLGLTPSVCRRKQLIPCNLSVPSMAISVTDYRYWREELLRSRTHLHLSDAALRFQYELCRAYGGGFYVVGDGVAAAYRDGERAVIPELLTPRGVNRQRLAASLGAELGAKDCLLLSSAAEGEPYLAALPGSLPADCVWNLSFD